MTVRNRIMQTAHVKLFSVNGVDSARDLAYQVERARGGIGLIVTGNRLVHPTSSSQGTARVYSWGFLERALQSDRKLTAAVHDHGAAIFVQLNHLGAQASSESADDPRVLFAPSPLKSPAFGEVAKEMEVEDIHEVTEWWARSAACCREAGFDGVEVHISHSYLLHEFFSPLYNKRTDEYGGPLENRLRFACEVVSAVRASVGPDFVVGVRLSLTDLYEGSLTVEDAIAAVPLLRAAGPIDYVNVSASGYHNIHLGFAPSDIPDGYLLEHIARLKPAVPDLPVFAVGGLKDAAEAEELVATGVADMVAMTREQIADPAFANKVRQGRDDEVYHCVRLNQGCFGRVMRGLPVGCTINPEAGREAKFGDGTMPSADPARRWLVVGGGPAGMKAAEILARRGHEVVLVERDDRLGGQLNLIVETPGRESFRWITRDIATHMRKNGVEIRLGTEATPELVDQLDPDGTVIATGALPSRTGFSIVAPFVTHLPGVDGEGVVTSWDAIAGTREIGDRVVVLDDEGTRATAGVCEVLLDRGKEVELVTRWNALFPGTSLTLDQAILYKRLFEKGLSYRLHSWGRGINGRKLTIYNLFSGSEDTLAGVDTVVLATAPIANDSLYFALKQVGREVHRIGDCVAPRKLDHAIYEGYVAGRELWTSEERYLDDAELYEEA